MSQFAPAARRRACFVLSAMLAVVPVLVTGCSENSGGLPAENTSPVQSSPNAHSAKSVFFVGWVPLSGNSYLSEYNAKTYALIKSVDVAPRVQPFISPSGQLYVLSEKSIGVYDAQLKLIRKITKHVNDPSSAAFDSNGNLYVKNNVTVAVFPGGKEANSYTIQIRARALAVDLQNRLYVAQKDSISIFRPGSRTPTGSITENLDEIYSMAADNLGNLYVANTQGTTNFNRGGSVTVYNTTSDAFEYTIDGREGIDFPYAFEVGSDGNLYVMNDSDHNTITVYPLGQSTLIRTISIGINSPNSLIVQPNGNVVVCDEPYVTIYTSATVRPKYIFMPNSGLGHTGGISLRP